MKRLSVKDLEALPITHQEVIPDDYLDEMGHVNVMWYTHFFSCATGRIFEHYQMTREYLETHNAGGFALEAHIRYLSEIRVGKHITVRSRAIARSAKRFHNLHFIVIDDDDVIAATGEFVGAHIDMSTRRMSPMPEHIGAAFDKLVAEHNKVGWDPPLCGTMRT